MGIIKMKPIFEHSWTLTPNEAISLQKNLATKVASIKLSNSIRYIAGIDCAPSKDMASYYSAAVIWDLQTREIVEYHIAQTPLTFPYVPGLLSFREIPAILEAIKKIQQEPDVVIVDGHGIAHPRRLGIAAHLGIMLDLPTFGCAKKLLYGNYNEPKLERGSISPLMIKNEIIGNVIRTKTNVKPVIISIGHKIDLASATELTMECSGKFRLPEPTHLADKLVAQKEVKSIFMLNKANNTTQLF